MAAFISLNLALYLLPRDPTMVSMMDSMILGQHLTANKKTLFYSSAV